MVMPPASSVANDRAACDAVICTNSFPVSGNRNITLSINKRPCGVRDQMNIPIDPTISAGTTQIALRIIQPDIAKTMTVTVGRLFPNPENKSDMRGTTNVVRKITMPKHAKSRNAG